ncbi:FadR/GntR family transcriptional regulator [Serratia rubidaea]|uniref:L-lactate utilization operon repressor n=1 Tax=Serratia rubidaea TaxID=61652 RepID=A0A3S4I1Z7_SERRU|nr:FadR/GntR family transcriptional regulator [Serratia rubidaea]MBD8453353.1 FadR family transcriptional regulator [Serratia rubidaea]UJD78705.1 FadR family transcriptional regulator [Serratia rubidaea]UJD83256.1 FadR family transcriptional regulator [Serratia rubidaea]VEA71693.1 L-lactate utilization operon repressor [Serratia rubidaea]
MPITRLENPRIYRQIADQLKRLIENNEFPPGSRLPSERDLAQQLQVSRASVREALIALEVIGLVDVKVGNGVIVKAPAALASQEPVMQQAGRDQWADIDDELNIALDFNAELPPFSLLQTRLLIEPETAALAARHASDEELAGIRDAYEQNCRDNRAGSATHPGDRLFHIRIAQASGNPAYAFIIAHLLGHRYGSMFRVLQHHYTPEDMPHRSEQEHRAILAALEARDVRGARKAMKAHLDQVIAIFARAR